MWHYLFVIPELEVEVGWGWGRGQRQADPWRSLDSLVTQIMSCRLTPKAVLWLPQVQL